MGTLEYEAEMTSSEVEQLIKGSKDTPVYEETFKEVVRKDLDLSGALDVLRNVYSGEIELKSLDVRADPSPLAEPAWKERSLSFEPVSPKRMKRLILGSVRARLLSEERTFACAECKDWVEVMEVHELSDPPTCSNCGSEKIGLVEEESRSVKRTLDRVENGQGKGSNVWKDIKNTSDLISEYGKIAAMALVGKGMTPSAAERILEEKSELSDEFLDLVMDEEKKSLLQSYG